MFGFEKRWEFCWRGKLSEVRGAGDWAACFALVRGRYLALLGLNSWGCVHLRQRITYANFRKKIPKTSDFYLHSNLRDHPRREIAMVVRVQKIDTQQALNAKRAACCYCWGLVFFASDWLLSKQEARKASSHDLMMIDQKTNLAHIPAPSPVSLKYGLYFIRKSLSKHSLEHSEIWVSQRISDTA